jgi:hypothetical protein
VGFGDTEADDVGRADCTHLRCDRFKRRSGVVEVVDEENELAAEMLAHLVGV